jgi:hypothetical protein
VGDLAGHHEEAPSPFGCRLALLVPRVRFHDPRSLASGPLPAVSLASRRAGRYT